MPHIYIMIPYPESLQFVFPRISTLQIVSVNNFCRSLDHNTIKYNIFGGRSQDGGGIGRRDHFLFYKLIERTTER